tara:strand:+ start:559 stop:1227 length:669 start_codon:yes stop_codon:yes gene_type:complete
MFEDIASRYDLMNILMSFGMDRSWRRRLVDMALKDQPTVLLDIGAGTGDLSQIVSRHAKSPQICLGLDFAFNMLSVAQRRTSSVYVQADARKLPVPVGSIDCIVTAFTIRNIQERQMLFSGFADVLRPGGRLVILEMTPMGGGPLAQLFRFYFGRIVPILGRIVSGHPSAYSYLPQSVERFPSAEALTDDLVAAGFKDVSYRRHGFGSVAIHEALRADQDEL